MKSKSDRGQPDLELIQPAPPEAAEKASLLRDVYERLKEEIFEFRMPPGQRYSEQALASLLGVSRTPLRLALHVLAREGYLNRLDGHSSWQVKPLDLAYYEDLYDFRVDLEGLAVRRLSRVEDLSPLSELRAYWNAPPAQRSRDFKAVGQADEHFHRTLVALAGNQEMLRCFTDLTERIRIIRRLDFTNPDRIAVTFKEHSKLLALLLARKADQAEMMVRAHIDASRAEIRHITLHRLALATARQAEPAAPPR